MKRLFIAGQEGMVGQAIYKLLKKNGFNIIDCKRNQLDLTCQKKVNQWFSDNNPTAVIHAAGRVGGILDNQRYQPDYIYINTMIGLNLLNAALKNKVNKFINLGSACSYPKKTKQPIKEEYLLSSYLEKTNEAYALAKIATIKYCEYIKNFYKKDFISLQPANLYGVADNFNLQSSHVIPALIRKFHNSKVKGKKKVEVWGSGLAKREFMHVNDLAESVLFCLRNKTSFTYANVSGPDHLSIKSLALLIKDIVGFEGKIFFNKKYPDGVKERRLDDKLLKKLGWVAKISLKEGLKDYYNYFKDLNLK
jgi:GDP-L-fucose synthase